MNLFLALILCSFSILLNAQDNARLNRDRFKLVLAVDSNASYDLDVKSSAYLNGPNVLQLYPGEKVYLEIEEVNGVISNITSVKENKNPDRTIEVSFYQDVKSGKNAGMILKINNPFKMNLTYSAKIFLMKESKWVETSVMPVRAGLSSFETWPDVIVTIALKDWQLSKDSNKK